jgi:predicted MPP superfamily phosphohydrolase
VLRRDTLTLPHWPRALGALTVGVLADLHTGAPHVDLDRVARVVERMNREHPDLVVLLGDYADPSVALGERVEPEPVSARLAELRAPLGRFAVLGNHDWHHYGGRMERALRDQGIAVLENDAARIAGAASPFWVVGVADAMTRNPRVDLALARVARGEPVLLLCHDPDVFPAVPDSVALTLSGHTHGAQVDLPLLRDRVTPSQHGTRYTDRHHVEDGRHLYVSSGVGTSRLPIRVRARPEIALLRLEAA